MSSAVVVVLRVTPPIAGLVSAFDKPRYTRKRVFDRPLLRSGTYPFDRTKRSRLNQCEFLGLALRNLERGVREIGWPEVCKGKQEQTRKSRLGVGVKRWR